MGSFYRAKGDPGAGFTLSGPFGTIYINEIRWRVVYLGYTNTTGAGDNGVTTYAKGNKTYAIALTGWLQDETPNETLGGDTFDDPVSVTLQLGPNTEKWAGDFEAKEVSVSARFQEGDYISVALSGFLTGAVTVTAGSST